MSWSTFRPPSRRAYRRRAPFTYAVKPQAPSAFVMSSGSASGEIDFTLSDNASDEVQINVYVRIQGSGDPWTKFVFPANTTAGTLTGLSDGSIYEGKATAQHINDESVDSNSSSATAGPATSFVIPAVRPLRYVVAWR